jgi:hypothetical protein
MRMAEHIGQRLLRDPEYLEFAWQWCVGFWGFDPHPDRRTYCTNSGRTCNIVVTVLVIVRGQDDGHGRLGQNAGMLFGPLIFGTLVQSAGWTPAFASLAVISALGLLAGWLARVR